MSVMEATDSALSTSRHTGRDRKVRTVTTVSKFGDISGDTLRRMSVVDEIETLVCCSDIRTS